jgi:hypothetical protein
MELIVRISWKTDVWHTNGKAVRCPHRKTEDVADFDERNRMAWLCDKD